MYILLLSVFANITIIAKNLLDMFIVIKAAKNKGLFSHHQQLVKKLHKLFFD